jgi:1-deoxy-D-xylulose-5-phosphate synthase
MVDEIHEIIPTDEAGAAPGATVDRVAYLAFVEITRGGVVCNQGKSDTDG